MKSQLFRSIIFSLFAITICSSYGVGQSTTGSTMGFSRQINGIVRYAGSNIPAENVLVRVERFAGGLEGQVMTDKTGKFSFGSLRAETYVVTIHAPGFVEIRQEVELLTQSSEYINATLIRDKNSMINGTRSGISILGPPVVDSSVPANAQDQFSAAKTILDSGKKDRIPEAIQHLQKAVSIYPRYLEAQLMLGYAYMDMHEWEKAETALRDAIAINPNASTAYFALGDVYRLQKKYAAAEEVLLQGIKVNEQAAAGHFALANVYFEKAPSTGDEAQFRQAMESSWKEVKRALELDPKHARAHLLAGDLLLRARHPKEALGHFEEYLKLEPNGEFTTQTKTVVEKIKKALSETKNS